MKIPFPSEAKQDQVKKIKDYTFCELSTHYLKWAERQKSFKCKDGFVNQLLLTFNNLPLKRFTSLAIEEWQT